MRSHTPPPSEHGIPGPYAASPIPGEARTIIPAALSPDILTKRFREGLESFIHYIILNRNLSAHTIRAYENDLQDFLHWFHYDTEDLDIPWEEPAETLQWLRQLPNRYVRYLTGRSLSRSSTARKTSSLKMFFKYLVREGYFSPFELPLVFPRAKLQRKLPSFLSPQDVQQLLQALDPPDKKTDIETTLQLRNQAIIEVLFSSGIRVAELVGLNTGDLDLQSGEIRVLGKGNKERIAFISDSACRRIQSYRSRMKSEDGAPIQEKAPLFLSNRMTRITVRSVHRMIRDLGQTAGFQKALHPHLFRHSFATHMLNHGADLRVVQELLGHASIQSTQIYTHITTERLRKAYMSAHPRARSEEPPKASPSTSPET